MKQTHLRRTTANAVLIAFAITLLPAMPNVAFAHGVEEHGKKKPGAVRKEQKPWGIAGDAKAARRTIRIAMADNMRFAPDALTVKQGETVRIALTNEGKMLHEMVIGTQKTLEEHAALMIRFPDMEHDEPYMAHVPAGGRGEIIWTFNRAGKFEFACLIAGHYQAGMKGVINVTGKEVTK